MGKVLGVKYILAGSITKFSTEKRGGGVRVKGIGLGGSKAKSEVALTARVIDATTGEILISAKGLGQSNKGGGVNFSSNDVGIGTNAEEWRDSALGDAQEKACNEFVAALVAKKDRLE
jgi:curli biogenesis system outer membrane secretion channel CsgG